MTIPPELNDLAIVVAMTALMWLPYTLAMIAGGGLMAAMGNRDVVTVLPQWAERAKRAHANAVENLVLFAPALLIASHLEPGEASVVLVSHVYVAARAVHWLAYVAGIPGVRTLAFAAGWGATMALLLPVLL